ncbi:hypothetical protein [Escherichia fergusonii]|uniref:hypothetical protein n=1 Tax=Escherichia fergusonii TaxID=564 RepID=UPI0006147267|nr:hypothetical protein [Escherichia fergusonii]KWW08277.1 hypothetical protein VL22_0201435 [Escherichia fergusonii]
MSVVENAVLKDDLDELTAMLQALDEPVQKASRVENTDEIDNLLEGLDSGIAVSSDDIVGEVIDAEVSGDFSFALNELEIEHESLNVNDKEEEEKIESDISQNKIISVSEEQISRSDKGKNNNKKIRSTRGPRFTLDDKEQSFFENAGLDKESFLAAYEKAPVKAKDKVLNLLNWFSGGPDISVYTVISLRHIIEANVATSNSIKIALMSNPEKPYPLNTASTQAGQMMAVFPATGVALREGGNLTLNVESPIIKKFKAEYTIG